MGPQKQVFLLLRTCFCEKIPHLPKQTAFLLLLRYPLGLFVLQLLRFTEADTILALTSVSLGLVCLAIAPGLPKQTPFLLLLRYPLGLFVHLQLSVYRSRRLSCSHFGIPLLDLIAPTLPTPAPRQHGRIFQRETFAARPRNEKYCDLCDQVYALSDTREHKLQIYFSFRRTGQEFHREYSSICRDLPP